jgi:hypothetical protein
MACSTCVMATPERFAVKTAQPQHCAGAKVADALHCGRIVGHEEPNANRVAFAQLEADALERVHRRQSNSQRLGRPVVDQGLEPHLARSTLRRERPLDKTVDIAKSDVSGPLRKARGRSGEQAQQEKGGQYRHCPDYGMGKQPMEHGWHQ